MASGYVALFGASLGLLYYRDIKQYERREKNPIEFDLQIATAEQILVKTKAEEYGQSLKNEKEQKIKIGQTPESKIPTTDKLPPKSELSPLKELLGEKTEKKEIEQKIQISQTPESKIPTTDKLPPKKPLLNMTDSIRPWILSARSYLRDRSKLIKEKGGYRKRTLFYIC